MRIQSSDIAFSDCHTVAVKKFQQKNGNLAAIIQPVTQIGRDEFVLFFFFGNIPHNHNNFSQHFAREEIILRHFIDTSHPCARLQDLSHMIFVNSKFLRKIARARRAETFLTL